MVLPRLRRTVTLYHDPSNRVSLSKMEENIVVVSRYDKQRKQMERFAT